MKLTSLSTTSRGILNSGIMLETTPPAQLSLSKISVLKPALAKKSAADKPAGPAPTTAALTFAGSLGFSQISERY